ncbi:hypothetical protein M9458_003756, partial [Cirrhinus mrigala]
MEKSKAAVYSVVPWLIPSASPPASPKDAAKSILRPNPGIMTKNVFLQKDRS